jgi:hypothetical protein
VRTLAAVLALLACAGCGGTRVRVTDATTGAAIRGARVVAEDARGATLARAGTSGAGAATLTLPERVSVVLVSADGYKLQGIPRRALPDDGTITVALEPAWLGSFMDGGVHRDFAPGESHDGTPERCHCHDAR